MQLQANKKTRPTKTAEGSIMSTGWFSPINQQYAPLGSLANVYKGCKIIKQRLNKFRLDVDLPPSNKQCSFLKGESDMIGFVSAYNNMKHGKEKEYKSILKGMRMERSMNLKEVKADSKREYPREYSFTRENVDNGASILQKELCDSFLRLNKIRKGGLLDEVVSKHPPSFYISNKDEYEKSFRLSRWYLPKSSNSKNVHRHSIDSRFRKFSKQNFSSGLAVVGNYHKPSKKNELRKSVNMNQSEDQYNLSLRSSRVIEPYIKLLSLKEVIDKYKNKTDRKLFVGIKKNFNPLELVQAVSELLDKLHKNALRKKRYLSHNGIGTAKKNVIKKRIQKRNIKAVSDIVPITDILDKIGMEASNIIESIKRFNDKKRQLKESLINSLDAQINNRFSTMGYKRRNLFISNEQHPFKSVLEKILTSAERDKIRDYIEGLKVHARNYYRSVESLLKFKGELHSDVYYIMDYYKSLIESGYPIGSQQILFLMDNLYPSAIPQQITE